MINYRRRQLPAGYRRGRGGGDTQGEEGRRERSVLPGMWSGRFTHS